MMYLALGGINNYISDRRAKYLGGIFSALTVDKKKETLNFKKPNNLLRISPSEDPFPYLLEIVVWLRLVGNR